MFIKKVIFALFANFKAKHGQTGQIFLFKNIRKDIKKRRI